MGRLAPQFSLTFITFYTNKLGFLDMIDQKSLTKIDVYEDTGILYAVAKIRFDLFINTNSLEYINSISIISTI